MFLCFVNTMQIQIIFHRLAQHITYVHQHCSQPPTETEAIDMKLIRKYIKLCKTKEPIVSEELTEYIVGVYTYELCMCYCLVFFYFS